ncbi:SDR family NAD(P)-dependent oxidoreductase [Trabulsiella odontotermitis]|uniref:SDR family NAD(P)-dependent oxidoreductase n=1 Tax=Trabulsiella odontotermitis TaxID=379893 RepID=UPI000675DCF6|nr:SDR family oxidoreductase [Trabulsiella odontotermitis]KNC92062.1 oxidoreductase [Trabulsiella odontotermitis]
MKLDLSSRVAVVSGSTSGIGLGIAKGLATAGATVVIVGRKAEGVDSAIATLAAELPGAKLRGVVADLSTREGVDTMIAAEPTADVLVNNLGIFNDKDFFTVPDDEWMHFYNVNVLSGVRLSRHYAQTMMAQGWGRIIFVSSESGVAIPGDMINYGVTKSANLAVSHGLAKRLAGTGVTVNAILPGPTWTEGLKEMLADAATQSGRTPREQADEFVRTSRPSSIIQRAADVDEVANLAVYLASPLSSATTGAALRVDGGVVDTLAM